MECGICISNWQEKRGGNCPKAKKGKRDRRVKRTTFVGSLSRFLQFFLVVGYPRTNFWFTSDPSRCKYTVGTKWTFSPIPDDEPCIADTWLAFRARGLSRDDAISLNCLLSPPSLHPSPPSGAFFSPQNVEPLIGFLPPSPEMIAPRRRRVINAEHFSRISSQRSATRFCAEVPS